jgi:tetratricopeptide (TPR) repeat protein
MTSLRLGSSLLALVFSMSCSSLSYAEDPKPLQEPEPLQDSQPLQDSKALQDPIARPEPMETSVGAPVVEPALAWSDLTRRAREHGKRGELDEARERLDQAAIQVRPLSPIDARRRTVFGARARLAIELADAGKIESADELADELLAESEAEPELGGAALVSLALSVAKRRESESQLAILSIALTTAQTGVTSQDRMNLSFQIAEIAYRDKDFVLARRAIDQAVSDAQHIGPERRDRIAALELYRARIALAQADLEAAETSATTANQVFEEISAGPSMRGIAEATLAEILAEKGSTEKALMIARGAHARIGGQEQIQDHAQRVILASLARVELSAGESVSAREHFERALAIPAVGFSADDDLVEQLTLELQALGGADAS